MKPYYKDDWVTIYHGDCREILPTLPKVDLVLTDPPYGIGEDSYRVANREKLAKTKDYGEFHWDVKIERWIIELILTKSSQCAIWGGNYYGDWLQASKCWLVWDKQNSGDFADCELAWTNFHKSVRIIHHLWNGMIRKDNEARFHPTQKPLEVMTWAIHQAPIDPQTILDPFMGSGTTLRAAKDLNRKAIGIEIEEKYCEIAAKRMSQEVFDLTAPLPLNNKENEI